MQFFSQLFLSALLVAHTAIAAPMSFDVVGRADAEALSPNMEMAQDFSISDLANALNNAVSVLQKVASTAKPIVDAVDQVASTTQFAPAANLADSVVGAVANLPQVNAAATA